MISFSLSILLDRFVKGCYAVSVTGRLPPGIIRELKSKGITYRSRDTSQKNWRFWYDVCVIDVKETFRVCVRGIVARALHNPWTDLNVRLFKKSSHSYHLPVYTSSTKLIWGGVACVVWKICYEENNIKVVFSWSICPLINQEVPERQKCIEDSKSLVMNKQFIQNTISIPCFFLSRWAAASKFNIKISKTNLLCLSQWHKCLSFLIKYIVASLPLPVSRWKISQVLDHVP